MTAPRALVVGASSTIGRAIATDPARHGHQLVLWGRDQSRLDETATRAEPSAPAAAPSSSTSRSGR